MSPEGVGKIKMSRIVEQTWRLPEVDTVFDLVFAMHLGGAADGHRVAVTCLWPPTETRHLRLHASHATPVCLQFKSGYELRGRLEVILDGDRRNPSIGVYADLSYDWSGQPPVRHFRGLIFLLDEPKRAPKPPPGPIPPRPSADDDDAADTPPTITPHDELFPYVYARQWPRISAEDLEYGFFGYDESSPPAGTFIVDLGNQAAEGRAAMEALAIDFVDGKSPYAGQFIPTRSSLPDPVGGFAALALRLPRGKPWREEWVDQLRDGMAHLLHLSGQTGTYLLGDAYRAVLDRVWQSYFALVVLLGYDQALLSDLALTLWAANAAAKALTIDEDGHLHAADLTPDRRSAIAQASVRLPAGTFPLPPAGQGQGAPPASGADGWVEPYAVGDLQMVRQRLVRYAAGEIARIENVMRGERREVSSRQGRQRLDLQQKQSGEEQILASEDSDARSFLLEETSRKVAGETVADSYGGFQTSYGPPTQVTLDGTRSRVTTAQDPGSDDVTRFAREILGKTVNRISRKVGTVRASSTLSHVEDEVVSVIDNSGGERDLCVVYRWVNKVYEACVVNYGNRLIMEFVVRRPAAGVIDGPADGPERARLVPISLEAMGVSSFEDVTPDNYAGLCAAYAVTDIAPPPPPLKFVTVSLRAGEERQVAIPAGYAAAAAAAGCLPTPADAPAPAIMVGCQLVVPGAEAAALTPYGDDGTLPISVADVPASLSPPAPEALVNVEIQCGRTPGCLDEWRIGIYGALVGAREERAERAIALLADGAGPPALRSPLACREIERRALRKGCTRLLLEQAALMTGADAAPSSPPSPAEAYLPRTLQFVDAAMEWSEMTYAFQPDLRDGAASGDAFAGLLGADQARVLVPVRPERVIAFLYFFASGTIWDGPDRLIAINDENLDVADDLKRAARRRERERRVGRPWEVVVPTAMQVLDGGDRPAQGRDLVTVTGDATP